MTKELAKEICQSLTDQIQALSQCCGSEPDDTDIIHAVMDDLSKTRMQIANGFRPAVSEQALTIIKSLLETGKVLQTATQLSIPHQSVYRSVPPALRRMGEYAMMVGLDVADLLDDPTAQNLIAHAELGGAMVELWEACTE